MNPLSYPISGFSKCPPLPGSKRLGLGFFEGKERVKGGEVFYLNAIKKYALSSFGKGEL
jgi:hypothetical protein